MTIPSEIKQLLAMVRQQHPELANMPDEILAQMVMQAMEAQNNTPTDSTDIETMSAHECGVTENNC